MRQAANSSHQLSAEKLDESFEYLKGRLPVKPAGIRPLWPRLVAAASILVVLSLGTYFLLHKNDDSRKANLAQPKSILPGGSKAILTLANGKQIILTQAKNGRLLTEANTEINKTADGSVLYKAIKTGHHDIRAEYNTLSTPRSGQYHLTLADGTGVWLNAASSIKYPVAFTGAYREVEISGEAYFEVAHNPARPFRVKSNAQVVEVLGTHFNINAYSDEMAVKTTLLEGSVKVTPNNNGTSKLLKPGQQAALSGSALSVESANVEEATAWKNGYFRFNNEKIRNIMRQLSRWYDIDVQYDGDVTDEGFYGTISRYKNIGEVLEMIQQTKGVHFTIEGRRITVTG